MSRIPDAEIAEMEQAGNDALIEYGVNACFHVFIYHDGNRRALNLTRPTTRLWALLRFANRPRYADHIQKASHLNMPHALHKLMVWRNRETTASRR